MPDFIVFISLREVRLQCANHSARGSLAVCHPHPLDPLDPLVAKALDAKASDAKALGLGC